MSKRRIERDMESLSEDVLGGLSPEERVRLIAEHTAAGNDTHTTTLRETVPIRTFRARDLAYRNTLLITTRLANEAAYLLHVSYLEYRCAVEREDVLLVASIAMPDGLEAVPGLDRDPIDFESRLDQAHQAVRTAGTGLTVQYRAHRRFAEEHLDLTVDELLALSSFERLHVDLAAVVDWIDERGHVADPVGVVDEDGRTDELPLDDAVQQLSDELVRVWTDDDEDPDA